MENNILDEVKEKFFQTNVEGFWLSTTDIPIPTPINPTISPNILFTLDQEKFETLTSEHYLEITNNISAPIDFFTTDAYIVRIQILDEIKQVRFTRNEVDGEKYATTIFVYDEDTYQYTIYAVKNDVGLPIIKISSSTLSGEGE